jgi:CheY-like chemotaxis protein
MTQGAASQASRRGNALVVDDSLLCRSSTASVLRRLGYSVSTAPNGLAAVCAASLTSFELISMDVQMPVMGGLECAKQIRVLEKATGTRATIIGISAIHCMEECLDAGMDAYLTKPATLKSVRDVLVGRTGER